MVMLTTKDITLSAGFLLYGGQTACFTDSTNIETSGWVGFVDPKTKIGGSQRVHTDVFVEDEETDYVNPLAEKANAMKCINIVLFRVFTDINAAGWEDFIGPMN